MRKMRVSFLIMMDGKGKDSDASDSFCDCQSRDKDEMCGLQLMLLSFYDIL